MTNKAAWSAVIALSLVLVQYASLRLLPWSPGARIALPLTMAAIPIALWRLRGHAGVWVTLVGLAANLAAVLANGGLMPIERATVVSAVGAERAGDYRDGEWIRGSKDVLLAPGSGHLRALGDSIVVKLGRGGFVASPGDLVVWCGLVILSVELACSWQRSQHAARDPRVSRHEKTAEGGAVTQ